MPINIQDISISVSLGETGEYAIETKRIHGELDSILIESVGNNISKSELIVRNAASDEIYVLDRDIQLKKIFYPRIQPHLMNTTMTGETHAMYGVERKALNEPLKIEINGMKNAMFTLVIRILK